MQKATRNIVKMLVRSQLDKSIYTIYNSEICQSGYWLYLLRHNSNVFSNIFANPRCYFYILLWLW